MGAVNRIYNILPRLGQILVLNAYGFRTFYRKKLWHSIIENLQSSEYWKREEQISYVSQKLKLILLHTIQTVPRYKSYHFLLSHINDPDADIFSILLEMPKITRAEILENPLAFMSNKPGTRRIVKTLTSGTTGTPFTTWMSRNNFIYSDSLWWRRTLWAGYKKGDWIARLAGDPIIPLSDTMPKKPWRISWTDRRIYFSTFHLNKSTARAYLNIMERYKPAFLTGYPSALEILVSYALEENWKISMHPKAILFSSEPLYKHQKEKINRVFDSPIIGLYGSAERVISAAQCTRDSYHLSLVDGYMEGQFGILPCNQPALVTSLINKVMPLIRFSLGDDIRVINDLKCECERTLPIIDSVLTKDEDWISTPSGRKISSSALTWAFKGIEGIRQSQIVQLNQDSIRVYLDIEKNKFEPVAAKLEKNLNKMLFGEMKISFIWKENIQVSIGGKSRFIINKLRTENIQSKYEGAFR